MPLNVTAVPCLSDNYAWLLRAAPAAEPQHSSEMIFPLESWHNHSSSIVETPKGDLLVCWFHGSGERTADDVVIRGARWNRARRTWSQPFTMADAPGFPETNPVLFIDRRERLLHLGRHCRDRLAAAGGKGLRFDQLMAEMLVMTDKPEEALKRLGEDAAPESLRIRANALLSLDSTEKAVELWQAGTAQVITRDALRLAYDYGSYLANAGDIARARSLQAQMAAVDANAFETLMLAAEIARETDDAAGAAASGEARDRAAAVDVRRQPVRLAAAGLPAQRRHGGAAEPRPCTCGHGR